MLVHPWQTKLQQQCALQRVKVVVGNKVNQSSALVFSNCDTLEVVHSQRRVEPKQLLTVKDGTRPYTLSSNPLQPRRKTQKRRETSLENNNIPVWQRSAIRCWKSSLGT